MESIFNPKTCLILIIASMVLIDGPIRFTQRPDLKKFYASQKYTFYGNYVGMTEFTSLRRYIRRILSHSSRPAVTLIDLFF